MVKTYWWRPQKNEFLGSGLSPQLTQKTQMEKWPGENTLGQMLMALRREAPELPKSTTNNTIETKLDDEAEPADSEGEAFDDAQSFTHEVTQDEQNPTASTDSAVDTHDVTSVALELIGKAMEVQGERVSSPELRILAKAETLITTQIRAASTPSKHQDITAQSTPRDTKRKVISPLSIEKEAKKNKEGYSKISNFFKKLNISGSNEH